MKAKTEKEKGAMERDLQEAKIALDEGMRDRANLERNCKMSQGLIVEANQKLDEMARALSEADSSSKKLQIENQDMTRQIEDTENAIAQLGKTKISLTTQLEDTKKLADAEARDRAALTSKFKNLTSELESLRDRIEEESEKKSDALRTLSKAQAETQLWRSKFETEGLGRVDELEGSKAKITARLVEAEETIDSLNSKVASTEKTKYRLEAELEDLQMEYERVHAAAVVTEKRGRNFDKVRNNLYLFIGRIITIFYNTITISIQIISITRLYFILQGITYELQCTSLPIFCLRLLTNGKPKWMI